VSWMECDESRKFMSKGSAVSVKNPRERFKGYSSKVSPAFPVLSTTKRTCVGD